MKLFMDWGHGIGIRREPKKPRDPRWAFDVMLILVGVILGILIGNYVIEDRTRGGAYFKGYSAGQKGHCGNVVDMRGIDYIYVPTISVGEDHGKLGALGGGR